MLQIPEFKTKKELFAFLIENKETLISQKMSEFKNADGIGVSMTVIKDANAIKGAPQTEEDVLTVKVVINTTNIMDSHKDVHMPGLWKKSLQENKRMMHVQEHQSYSFDKIISSGTDLKAYTQTFKWKDLGFDAEGETEALVFESKVRKSRNPYMFEQYKNGWVDNHSVGMRYVKIEMAINDADYEKEKNFWDLHLPDLVNPKDAENTGYFFLVTEAKAIEGSAVPNGSNPVTPTIENKDKILPTENELKTKAILDWMKTK